MFTFVGGPYTPKLTTISAATMNYLRGTAVPNSLDIIGGGTYTPQVQTELTGTIGLKANFSSVGLQVGGLGGLHILSGSTAYIDTGGFLVIDGTQTLNGTTVYNAGVTFNSTVTVSATGAITVHASSTTTLNGPLAQVGAATFSAAAVFNGATSIGAAGSFATNVAATSTFGGPCTFADLTMTSTNNVKLTSRSITRSVEHSWIYLDADWILNSSGFPVSAAVGKVAWLSLHFPHGVTINTVTLYILPIGGHGALPAVMPSIEIFDHGTAGLATSHGSATDGSATVGAYQALHTITITGIATSASRLTQRFVLKFTDESGANSIAGQQLKLCLVTYTTTAMDED